MVSAFFTGTVIPNLSVGEPKRGRLMVRADEFLGSIPAVGVPAQHAPQHRQLGPCGYDDRRPVRLRGAAFDDGDSGESLLPLTLICRE